MVGTGVFTTSCIVSSNKLYFGGGYGSTTFAGTSVNGIGSFDGEIFDSLNQGIYGEPNDVVWYNGKLIVAGHTFCSGVPPNCVPNTVNISAWDSTSGWESITPNGGGADYQINCLEVYNNDLYAAGQFVTIDNVPVNRIAKWNGTSWTDVGGGLTGGMGEVICMTVFHNQLYVGGNFTAAGSGNLSTYYVARWNGASWDSVGTGFNYPVHELLVDSINDVLYAGGEFSYIGNTICRGVAVWNDVNWSPVGSGLDTLWGTRCLEMFNGELYAGGGNVTTTTQGDTINNIYKFNGTKWVSVDGGANSTVMDMSVYGGNLYIGGYFSQVGYSTPANKIACYGTTCPTSVGIHEYSSAEIFKVYPNPASEVIIVQTSLIGDVYFTLQDVNGNIISQTTFDTKVEFSTIGIAAGIYTICVKSVDGTASHSEKIVIQH